LAARRRIPRHAFGLKKYLGGTGPVSKTSDNEHTLASLGQAEVLSVKHAVGPPVPEFPQRPEDGAHVPPFVRRQKTGDILDQHPPGTSLLSDSRELEEESGSLSSQASTASCQADILARKSPAKKPRTSFFALVRRDVIVFRGLGPVVIQDATAGRVDLDLAGALESGAFQAQIQPPHAGEQADESPGHHVMFSS